MSTSATVESNKKAPAGKADPKKVAPVTGEPPLLPPEEKFWERYSPHHEFPLSSIASFSVHILAIVVLVVGAWIAWKLGLTGDDGAIDTDAVVVIAGGGGDVRGSGTGQGSNLTVPGEFREDVKPEENPKNPPPTTPLELEQPKQPDDPLNVPDLKTPDSKRLIDQSNAAIQASKALSSDVRKRIFDGIRSEGQGGTGTGGGYGSGTGTGTGSGVGAGVESKLTQRQKRVLRWVMIFNTQNGDDYARQLKELGATLAVPDPGNKNNWLVIRDLTQRPAKGVSEDLSSLKQIYWIDNRPDSIGPLARALGLRPAPDAVVAFFPVELERKLVGLELAYSGKNVKEDDIEETRFVVTRVSGTYVPKVESQRLK